MSVARAVSVRPLALSSLAGRAAVLVRAAAPGTLSAHATYAALMRAQHTSPVSSALRRSVRVAALPPKGTLPENAANSVLGAIRTYASEPGKYVRTKPHMNIGTIGHVGTYSRSPRLTQITARRR